MSFKINLSKGFDIKLSGEAVKTITTIKPPSSFAIKPTDFIGITRPKLLKNVGDEVKAGTPILFDKLSDQIMYCSPVSGEIIEVDFYEETLPNGKRHISVYRKEGTMINSDEYVVPKNHYFFMGDNRDCSKDSRFLSSVGYVNFNNLVGKAQIIFFSNNKEKGPFYKFWKWKKSLRTSRFFKRIE